MKKVCCIVALAAISFGTVCSAAPITGRSIIQTDTTTKMKKKKMKMKSDTGKMKMKMKKDTTKM
jgi:hypothetical protein